MKTFSASWQFWAVLSAIFAALAANWLGIVLIGYGALLAASKG